MCDVATGQETAVSHLSIDGMGGPGPVMGPCVPPAENLNGLPGGIALPPEHAVQPLSRPDRGPPLPTDSL